jgi:membrane peptidoglycan carboxypeptidase
MDNVHGITVTGGTLPAQIWHQFMASALTDVPPDKFPDPPASLLAPPGVLANLTVAPANGGAGATVTVDGAGYNQCAANWYVTLGAAQSAPQSGSTDDHRTTTVVVPAGAPPGAIDVQAWCDTGAGPQAVAHATFTVDAPAAPPPTPATSPPPTTSAPPATAPPSPPESTPANRSTTTTSTTTTTIVH